MHNLSIAQALDVWSELEMALHGTNGYGRNVAEIYVYRFSPDCPSLDQVLKEPERWKGTMAERNAREDLERINTSLFNLLSYFAAKRDAIVELEYKKPREERMVPPRDDKWRKVGAWVKKTEFSHRIHVRVKKKGQRIRYGAVPSTEVDDSTESVG